MQAITSNTVRMTTQNGAPRIVNGNRRMINCNIWLAQTTIQQRQNLKAPQKANVG